MSIRFFGVDVTLLFCLLSTIGEWMLLVVYCFKDIQALNIL